MKIEILTGTKGEKVTEYIPETEEDLETLRQMEIAGDLDSTDYFHGERKTPLTRHRKKPRS